MWYFKFLGGSYSERREESVCLDGYSMILDFGPLPLVSGGFSQNFSFTVLEAVMMLGLTMSGLNNKRSYVIDPIFLVTFGHVDHFDVGTGRR